MSRPGAAAPQPDADPYVPIACDVHDRLESWAVRGASVDVVWRDGAEERRQRTGIADVFARGGADWVTLSTGPTIRADRLTSVGGVPVTSAC